MADLENMSEAGRAAFERARRRSDGSTPVCSNLRPRAENEDDDGYDPYPDYMDALARNSSEPLEADPWR